MEPRTFRMLQMSSLERRGSFGVERFNLSVKEGFERLVEVEEFRFEGWIERLIVVFEEGWNDPRNGPFNPVSAPLNGALIVPLLFNSPSSSIISRERDRYS